MKILLKMMQIVEMCQLAVDILLKSDESVGGKIKEI
jgi:hypothetical protein